MKLNRFFAFTLTLLLSASLFSCKELTEISKIKEGTETNPPDGENPPKLHESNNGNSNQTVNNWIYEVMNIFYLWQPEMAAKSKTNTSLQPDDYFESLLNQPGEIDRFSWIDDDAQNLRNSLAGVTKASGMAVTAFRITSGSNDLIFAVRYTIKDSPAEKAGVKRGDIITKINGQGLNIDNYISLMQSDSQVLTLGEWKGNAITSTDQTISLTTAQIQNYPVQYTSIIDLGTKKVGYIVYTQFIPGVSNNSSLFDNQLRSVFGDFKANGVNELVVDLRYNGGGYVSSSDILSSLIVKNLQPGTLMNKQEWSKNGESYAKTVWKLPVDFFETKWLNETNNIGDNLNRVFFLVSGGTASASELVINNLLPFMDVILIGSHSYGKAVGSITLDDEGGGYRWNWGLQPIVFRTVNSQGKADYGTKDGFKPDYEVSDNKIPFLPFGDQNETLLSVALNLIKGSPATASARLGSQKSLPIIEEIGGLGDPRNNIKDMFIKVPSIR